MILFNTTFVVDLTISRQFLSWVKSTFIPEALSSGIFEAPLLTRILSQEGEPSEAESFALQFKSRSLAEVRQWQQEIFPALYQVIAEKHPGAVLPFSTYMEIL